MLSPFLASIGLPLVPHIDHVFSTNDEVWKYWMIVCLISQNDDLFAHYKNRLVRFAELPTDDDRYHELNEVARDALHAHGQKSNSNLP